jgi:hypothetical protein
MLMTGLHRLQSFGVLVGIYDIKVNALTDKKGNNEATV